MRVIHRYRVKGSPSLYKLAKQLRSKKFVRKWAKNPQKPAVRWRRPWLRPFDRCHLAGGACHEIGLGAQIIQSVCEPYAISQKMHKRRRLRYRGRRIFGEVVFEASGIMQVVESFTSCSHIFRAWLSHKISGGMRLCHLCSACGRLPESRPTGIAQLGLKAWTGSHGETGHDRAINAARTIFALRSQGSTEGIPAL